MERTEILSWFFGIGAMFSLFLVYQQKQRKKLLVCKLCADLCWVAHYLCLGACGGVIPNFIGIFRELIFISREKRRWANHIFWPIFFICLIFLGITSFDNTINISARLYEFLFKTINNHDSCLHDIIHNYPL